MPKVAKYNSNREGHEVLFRYYEHYDKLEALIMNNDRCGVVQLFHNFIEIRKELKPFYHNEDYRKACNDNHDNHKDMLALAHSLCNEDSTHTHGSFLHRMNDYLQSLANRLNDASDACHHKIFD